MPNYAYVGGWAYQPGSAAYKRALQLQAAMPKTTTPQDTLSQYAPTPRASQAPSNFPSYPTGVTGGTGGPNLVGAPGMAGQGAFGLVPQVPDPLASAREAIAGNVANLPGISTLGTGTTTLNANLGALPYQMNLPGYGGMIGEASQGIAENLRGEIDFDALEQYMAERGAMTGLSPDSPINRQRLMEALAMDIQKTKALGMGQLNQAIARTPTGIPFNAAGFQVGQPEVQSARYGANVAAAAPDPYQTARANLDMLLEAIRAGQMGGLGGMGGMGGMGPRLGGGGMLSPVSSTYPGFNMPYYWTAPTAPGKSVQPFYRTYPTTPSDSGSEIPQYWPEGMPGEIAPGVGELNAYPEYWGGSGVPNVYPEYPGSSGLGLDPYSLGGYGYGESYPDMGDYYDFSDYFGG